MYYLYMPQQQQHKYLTNCVLIVIVCGVILAYVGNFIIKGADGQSNTPTCDKSILRKLASQEQQSGENGFIIAFTGNLITAAGILFLLLLSSLFSINNSGNTASTYTKIKAMIQGSMPSVLTFGVIIYIIILNSMFKENIIKGHVANEYFTYSSFSAFLILIQVGLLIKYITDISNNKDSPVGPVIYVFSIINIMIIGIMQIILQFFSTDG